MGLYVILGWWEKLSEHYVHLTKEKKSKDEIIKYLKTRVLPIKKRVYKNKWNIIIFLKSKVSYL